MPTNERACSNIGKSILVAVASIVTIAPASAEDPVYKGKQIKMVVTSGAGGGYDVYARMLATYLEKQIPGNPSIVAQNMPGASGITGTNWGYAIAPKDGSVIIATANAIFLEPLYGNAAAKYDVLKFNWIGSSGKQQAICAVWHETRFKTIDDIKNNEIKTSATGAAGGPAIWPRLINDMLGTKIRVIMGYTTGETRLAVERGEVDGVCGYAYSTLKAAQPDWIINKKIRPIVQMGTKPLKDYKDVPLLYDYLSPENKQIVKLLFVPDEMGRPYAMPPGSPKTHVDAVRAAFDTIMKDKEFLADAEKRHFEIDPVSGAEMDQILKAAYETPKEIVTKAIELIGRAKATPGEKKK